MPSVVTLLLYILAGASLGSLMLLTGIPAAPLLGAILGGLVIGLLEHLAHYFDVHYLNIGNMIRIAPFYALIIILMIKPYGFFGTKDIERV